MSACRPTGRSRRLGVKADRTRLSTIARTPHEKGGVAFMIVLSVLAIIMILLTEIGITSRPQKTTLNASVDNLKAYYSALSGFKISSLLVIAHARIAQNEPLKKLLGGQTAILDELWKMGFQYPLPIADSEIVTSEPSALEGTISVRNEDLSSKINLNTLASDDEDQLKATRSLLKNYFLSLHDTSSSQEAAETQEFNEKKGTLQKQYSHNIDVIIDNIQDWVDEDNSRPAGGRETDLYKEAPYGPKNAPMETISELHLIFGIKDDLFDFLEPAVTVYGDGNININTASFLLIKSLSPELQDRHVEQIIQKRPFRTVKEFEEFVTNQLLLSAKFNKEPKVSLTTEPSFFKIESVAQVGRSVKKINAIIDRENFDTNGQPMLYYFQVD
ncbi:MAG: general secretion pathway protein GspK [Deltaproteobacteria bacterium]|nr:general secretion pathway protein GspK [Deltaproteobacteria bacterium]